MNISIVWRNYRTVGMSSSASLWNARFIESVFRGGNFLATHARKVIYILAVLAIQFVVWRETQLVERPEICNPHTKSSSGSNAVDSIKKAALLLICVQSLNTRLPEIVPSGRRYRTLRSTGTKEKTAE
jgi:hypothetical protein